MGLLDRISARTVDRRTETRYSADTWISDYLIPAQQFSYGGHAYPLGLNQTYLYDRSREISSTLPGYMAALRSCPPAFGAQLVRASVLSQARFCFRNADWSPKAGRTFTTSALEPLQKPWTNATTGQLINVMEWHEGLAGNAYVTNRTPRRLRVLRPDWVVIVYGSHQQPEDAAHALDGELIGYGYCNGGIAQGKYKLETLLPDEVAHWSPLPDPECAGIGMSWITPAIREIQGDKAATDHKLQFFANGAPQPLDAKILTPSGWSTMGAMRVGQRVIGVDGKPHAVTAIHPQGERDIYRVLFADGTTAECTLDHVWTVSNNYDRQRGVTRDVTLADLMADGFHYRSGPAKWAVPMADPVEFDSVGPLPMDPYLLGLLLGDGSFRSNGKGSGGVTLACDADDVDEAVDTIAPMLPAGVAITRRERGGWSELYFRGPNRVAARGDRGRIASRTPNPMTDIIRSLGLWDVPGRDKFVPDLYLRAAVKERIAVLQGLIDSDGHVEATGLRFTTTSRRLADGVAELVGSLGGVAAIRQNKGRTTLTVGIRQLPDWIVPVRLLRKADAYRPTSALRVRTMVGAELARRAHAQCIAVDSDDHLYITDGFVVTHNTPNMVVKGITAATKEQFEEIVDALESRHAGVRNAYRTLYLAAGADATVVGADLRQIDFKATQGAGETRISMLSRVHPVILGASEGLQGSSLNAGNFGAARRAWADTWIYPALQDLAAALSPMVRVPADAELWTKTGDMPILREDAKDAAEIEQTKAATISSLITNGFTRKSVIAAVMAQDMTLLEEDPQWISVQLQQATGQQSPAPAPAGGAGPKVPPAARAAERKFNPAEPRVPGGEHGGEWGSGGGAAKKLGRMTMDEFFAAHGGDDAWHDQYGGADAPSLILWKNGQASLYYPTGKGQSHAFVLSGMDSHTARRFADAVDWAAKHPLDKPAHLPDGAASETRTVKLPDTEVHVGYGWDPGEESGSYLYISVTFPKGAAAGKDKTFTVDEAVEGSASSFVDDLRALADDVDSKAYALPIPGARAAVALFARRHDPLDPNRTMPPPGDDPDPVDALLAALEEFEAWLSDGARSWDPVKHPRNPKGSPGGGRFRSMVDRLTDALKEHHKGSGKGDPFEGFNREQLRRVAKARGHDLPRGIGRDEIAKLLLDDLGKTVKAGKPSHETVPGRDLLGGDGLDERVRRWAAQAHKHDDDGDSDGMMWVIGQEQGFNGPSHVVTEAEMDQLVAGGATEMWRGVTPDYVGISETIRTPAAHYTEQLRSGPARYGLGIYGNGNYFSEHRDTAEEFAAIVVGLPGGAISRATLKPGAHITTYADLLDEMKALDPTFERPGRHAAREPISADSSTRAVLSDPGVFAIAHGYDAYLIEGAGGDGGGHDDGQWVILNRTAMIIQDKDYES